MKTTPPASSPSCLPLLTALLFLNGCKSKDEVLYAYGTLAFLIFILITISLVALHHFHLQPWFQHARIKLRSILIPVSRIGIPIGVIMALASYNAEGRSRLGVFIGTITAVLFYCLQQWGKIDHIEKQRLYMKLAQLSFSFLVVLIFLYLGGKGLE